MNKTFIPTSKHKIREWYVIDCTNLSLGRLASITTGLLIGKRKSIYHPSVDVGCYVILINANLIRLNSNAEKFHVFQPGRPGSSLKRLVNILPKQIIENAIFGMLPNGVPKKHLVKRLKVYQGDQHPHAAQRPVSIIINKDRIYQKDLV